MGRKKKERQHVEELFYYDDDNYRYAGQRTGKVYRLGDAVRIQVKDIDLAKKQMNFVFVPKE